MSGNGTQEAAAAAGRAIMGIVEEYQRATGLHGTFNSAHEGYAVLLEEVDELWDAIKRNDHGEAIKEAVQVGAMALRFLVDCGRKEP